MRASRNLRVVAITSFLTGLANNMTHAVWQPFILSLGASMSTLGMLESLGGQSGIVTTLVQPVGGWLCDRFGRKPLIVLGNLALVAAGILVLVAAISGNWQWLLPVVILVGATMVAGPAEKSLVAESSKARERGMAYSIFVAAGMAPGIFAPILGGFLAGRWGYPRFFVLRLGLDVAVLLLALLLLRETISLVRGISSSKELLPMLRRMVVPPRQLRGLYWAAAADMFAWGLGGFILYGMLSETYGFTTLQLGIMSGLMSLVWTVTQLPIGKMIDRYGRKPLLAFSEVAGLVVTAGWALSRSFPAFAVFEACWGLCAAAWSPALMALLADSVPEGERGEAIGRLAAFRGLVGFPAPYIGGLLYKHLGFQAPIVANLVGVAVVLVLVITLVKEPQREEMAP